MRIGIVIVNYNDSKTTIELLDKIKKYEIFNMIIVVDNNSSDNSYECLQQYENDKIKIVQAEQNKGYGAGNNIGCKILVENKIDYIVISNPDVIFEEKDIEKLCLHFQLEDIAIVAPVVYENGFLNRGWKFQSACVDALSNINYIGRWFKKKTQYENEHYLNNYSKVDVVSGCFFLIRSNILRKVNYFDEKVFLYYEENILAKKIKNEGKIIIVDNKVKIIHNHSVSINKSFNKINKFKMLAKSQRYYHKTYNNAGIMQMAMLYLTYYLTLGISYILGIFK